MPQSQATDKRSIVMTVRSDSDVEAGNWYYGFLCKNCDQKLPLLDDPSKGKKPASISGEAHFRVTCPHCAAEHAYEAASIQQFKPSKK